MLFRFYILFYLQMSLKKRNFAVMIELDRHIEILLLCNDCVIVPGLGGFMAHHVTARYDEEDNMFFPPLRTLGFNPQLKLNDSLLAQSYIEAYDISYPEAIRRIEEEVNELKQHLYNEGSYELNDIGTLSLNDDGKYVFEPCEAGILTPDLYGLSSFEIKKEVAPAPVRPGQKQSPMQIQTKASESETEKSDEHDTRPIDNNDDDSTIKIKIAWIRNAASIAAAIIAFFFITTPISNSTGNHTINNGLQTANVLNIPTEKSEPAEDSVAAKIKETFIVKKDSSITKEKLQNATNIDATRKIEQEIGYCIVMASHVTRQNAEAYVKELHNNGYDKAHVYIHNKIVRVVYGNYTNETDAYSTLKDMRGNKYFEQSWVYRKK